MVIVLPWYAFAEWITNTQDMDWRGHCRSVASGPAGVVAVISFVVQLMFFALLGFLFKMLV